MWYNINTINERRRNYALKPIAESYEKQKQFVTDANHELKTPLTLILAKSIAEKHSGEITSYQKDTEHIGFKVVL